MSDRNLELIAEIQGRDLDEVIKTFTRVDSGEDDSDEDESNDIEDLAWEHLENLIGPTLDNVRDATVYERGEASNLNKSTYKQRETAIIQFVDWYKDTGQTHVNTQTVEQFLQHARQVEGYAPGTMETRYWQLVSWARDSLSGVIEEEVRNARHTDIISNDGENDSPGRQGKGARPIEPDERDTMLDACKTLRMELYVRILDECGLRAQELATVRVGDDQDKLGVDLNERTLTVRTAKRDGHSRTLSFGLRLENTLDKWLNGGYRAEYPYSSGDYLFPTKSSTHPLPRNVTRSIRELAKEAGVQTFSHEHQDGSQRAEITPHSFRKRFGLRNLHNGASVREVQILLGHTDIRTTQNYLELTDEDLINADWRTP